eukprot:gene7411-523_t
MPRKHAGVRGLKLREDRKADAQALGARSKREQQEAMQKQLDIFKANLEEFARKHGKQIKNSPDFRGDFQRMCHQIGVDPLASNKSFWGKLLGIGDFYYKLAVQVVEACMSTRNLNGGVIDINELLHVVERRRGSQVQRIDKQDIFEAVSRLEVLGSGFRVVKDKSLVISQPHELNADHISVFSSAKDKGFVSVRELCHQYGWTSSRAQAALGQLVKLSVAWVDMQATVPEYYIPGLIQGSDTRDDDDDDEDEDDEDDEDEDDEDEDDEDEEDEEVRVSR